MILNMLSSLNSLITVIHLLIFPLWIMNQKHNQWIVFKLFHIINMNSSIKAIALLASRLLNIGFKKVSWLLAGKAPILSLILFLIVLFVSVLLFLSSFIYRWLSTSISWNYSPVKTTWRNHGMGTARILSFWSPAFYRGIRLFFPFLYFYFSFKTWTYCCFHFSFFIN